MIPPLAANLVLTLAPAGAVLAALMARRAAPAEARRTWLLLALGSLAAVAGQIVWAYHELVIEQPVPFPSVSFYCFVALHVALAGAAIRALRPARDDRLAIEIALDGVLVVLVAGILAVRFVLEPPLVQGWLTRTQAVAMLVGQIATAGSCFFAVLLMVWRDTVWPARTVEGIAIGATVFLTGNVLAAAGFDPRPAASGDVFEVIWLAGWCALVFAGLYAARRPRPQRRVALRVATANRIRRLIIPCAALFLGFAAVDAGVRPYFTATSAVLISFMAAVLAIRIGHAMTAVARESEERRRAESGAAQARLRALTAQLNPHFLFNALHSLSALLHRDPDASERAVNRLGSMLRYALDEGAEPLVRLADEWAFAQSYIELEKLRFGDRLHVAAEIEADALDWLVPPFLIQPLVENAVRHGLASKTGRGMIRVTACIRGDALRIMVQDDGAGADPVALAGRSGIGLRAVRGHLDARYHGAATLDISTAPGEGFRVDITIPEGEAEP